ncbi:MAG: hypothetical protein HND56_01480 [Pseudomonadota bacterium]|nr:hypothetical protein [Pseudomonadota bacterium]QKK04434.1 MAG: hypothetical protein HND56_01480 [Pseudomonadota bacterium]
MASKFEIDMLSAELGKIDILLQRQSDSFSLSDLSLKKRKIEVEKQIQELINHRSNIGEVALLFNGDPVTGSYGINADFASDILAKFNRMIDTTMELVTRSRNVKHSATDATLEHIPSNLCITSIAHGSFGFLMEEIDTKPMPLFATPIKEAIEKSADILDGVTSQDDERFDEIVQDIDHAVFSALKQFIKTLHKHNSRLKLYEAHRSFDFDNYAITRAYNRTDQSEVDETEVRKVGRLIGVLPIEKKFEFQPDGEEELISGKIGSRFSEAYIHSLDTNEKIINKKWLAHFTKKTFKTVQKERITYRLEWLEDAAKGD